MHVPEPTELTAQTRLEHDVTLPQAFTSKLRGGKEVGLEYSCEKRVQVGQEKLS